MLQEGGSVAVLKEAILAWYIWKVWNEKYFEGASKSCEIIVTNFMVIDKKYSLA